MRCILDFSKTKLGVVEVVGRYAKDNPASGRVMEKPGFQYEKDILFSHNDGSVIRSGIQCRLYCRKEENE
ncbi:MAG: GNAT family N-acetyltransferase [Acutalibacteraceae bacterium]|nr:GNAT family N-acetyltransferase [Acutalibacteraceae bacterium]